MPTAPSTALPVLARLNGETSWMIRPLEACPEATALLAKVVSDDLVEIAQLNVGEKLFPFSPSILINETIRLAGVPEQDCVTLARRHDTCTTIANG
jgi:hypothetical protein